LPDNPFISDLRRYFIGPRGIRVPWRLLLYIALMLSLSGLCFVVLGRFMSFADLFPGATRGIVTPSYLIVFYSISFAADVCAAFLMSRIELRPFGSYGLNFNAALGKLFAQGSVLGLFALTALILTIYVFGGFSFGAPLLSGFAIMRYGALWAVACLVMALMGQFRYRGYLQFTLADGIGFWPAAVTISIVYAARHLFDNSRQSWSGLLSILAFNLMFSLALRRTGSLWWPIGFQAAWDFGQTFLYSVADSGYRVKGSLLNSSLHGDSPRWLTGGSVGPEGSVFCLLVLAILALFVAKFYPAKTSPDAAVKR
jgi:membrane protease YdiL (CAAX protease family)